MVTFKFSLSNIIVIKVSRFGHVNYSSGRGINDIQKWVNSTNSDERWHLACLMVKVSGVDIGCWVGDLLKARAMQDIISYDTMMIQTLIDS